MRGMLMRLLLLPRAWRRATLGWRTARMLTRSSRPVRRRLRRRQRRNRTRRRSSGTCTLAPSCMVKSVVNLLNVIVTRNGDGACGKPQSVVAALGAELTHGRGRGPYGFIVRAGCKFAAAPRAEITFHVMVRARISHEVGPGVRGGLPLVRTALKIFNWCNRMFFSVVDTTSAARPTYARGRVS